MVLAKKGDMLTVTNEYLKWLSSTQSYWWNKSVILTDMDKEILNGAAGVTTNPLLVKRSLYGCIEEWNPYLADMTTMKGDDKAEEIGSMLKFRTV